MTVGWCIILIAVVVGVCVVFLILNKLNEERKFKQWLKEQEEKKKEIIEILKSGKCPKKCPKCSSNEGFNVYYTINSKIFSEFEWRYEQWVTKRRFDNIESKCICKNCGFEFVETNSLICPKCLEKIPFFIKYSDSAGSINHMSDATCYAWADIAGGNKCDYCGWINKYDVNRLEGTFLME